MDTIRNKAACLDLLVVNGVRKINAQDMRDIIASAAIPGEGQWDDIQSDAREGDGAGSLQWEQYRDTPLIAPFMRSNQPDQLNFRIEFPHRRKLGTNVKAHVHLEPQADPAQDEIFAIKGQYAWARRGVATPANAGWTAFSATLTISPGAAFVPVVMPLFEAAAPAGDAISDIVLLHIERDTAVDTYATPKGYGVGANNMMVNKVDMHIIVQSLGSDAEY